MASDDSTQQPSFWDIGPVFKYCRGCRQRLPLEQFPVWRSRGKLRRWGVCKACYMRRGASQRAARRATDPGKYKKMSRSGVLKWRYSLSEQEFQELLANQQGVCAICGQPETKILRGQLVLLSIDHDHATGCVRGLLCNGCNNMLGRAKDDPARLRAAADYIERHRQKQASSEDVPGVPRERED